MRRYYEYWGKIRSNESNQYDFHLLPYHCLDVASIGNVLLHQNVRLREQLSSLSGLDESVLARWMVFFLALHDLGKFSDSFQNLYPEVLRKLQKRESTLSYAQRHDSLGFMLWREKIKGRLQEHGMIPKIGASTWGEMRESAYDIWMAIVTGHHGKPPAIGLRGLFRDHFLDPDDVNAATDYIIEVAKLLLGDDWKWTLSNNNQIRLASWWLAGFAVLCDWLGSNSSYFPFYREPMSLQDYWQKALKQAELAVKDAEVTPHPVGEKIALADFFRDTNKKEWKSTPLQALSSELPLADGPQLIILEDVTGAGKTEASVILAHRLMKTKRAGGFYFALPTMATANAMYMRMGHVYRRLYRPDAQPSLILAHAARHLDKCFRQSIYLEPKQLESSNKDETIPAGVHCSAWLADNRKKALLADIGVGTIDQALLAILPSRHQSLRLLGLLNKILIVDEVHACDSYMNTLLCALLRAHAAAGGSAILLSATLPSSQRQKLINAFAEGLGTPAIELPVREENDYPLLTHYHQKALDQHHVSTRDNVRRRIAVETLNEFEDVEKILAEAIIQKKCACWIRNTVADARRAHSILRKLHPDWSITLFHARFAMADRLAIEEDVLRRFGPSSLSEQRQAQVLIATQVVEQSLDLDFDVLVTDLAPIDLIIQRSGRLCRHTRDESGRLTHGSDKRGVPVLHIFGPEVDDDPSRNWYADFFPLAKKVYDNHGQLWLTARLLSERKSIKMPEDARRLIERVYSESAQEHVPSGLLASFQSAEGEERASAGLASLNALKIEMGYRTDTSNIWWDESNTPTRLGEPSITVYLATWDGLMLRPWAEGKDHSWQRSAVQVRTAQIAKESNQDIPQELIDECREQLPAKGSWGVLLPLVKDESGMWRGYALNHNDKATTVLYDKTHGLMMEEEYKKMKGEQ